MSRFDCRIEDIEELRLPNLYRAVMNCSGTRITVELHREIYSVNKGDKVIIEFSTDKDECLKHEFCGNSYVVSIKKINDKYRTILSIHGPLIVIYTDEKPKSPFKVMNKVYVGISKAR